jgi:hypothetical protein
LDHYEKQVNQNLSSLKMTKLIPLNEQMQKNKENFISNIKKNIDNYNRKESTKTKKINAEEILR